ncbi:hypothetical protein DL93DRAFT_2063479 [Clavulina sp. PMI_390]|nr:hypothetical protein DL93DRAFT_2063479 [Clavulina sp. PMI_390]
MAPPKIPARNPTRSLKESTTSSAFLSVSPATAPTGAAGATLPLTSLYLVSGLPKSPQTWTLADHDSTAGVHHSEGAVGRFWRAEVLGSSVTPGVGKKKRRGKGVGDDHSSKRLGTLSKTDLGKMLSKSLKLSFTREVEIIASTLQPASTVHTFTFALASSATDDGMPHTHANGLMRTSILSATTTADNRTAAGASTYNPYMDPSLPRPSSTYLGPTAGVGTPGVGAFDPNSLRGGVGTLAGGAVPGTTYYGVCLTVWSHADEERTAAIRRTLEAAARNRGTSTVGGAAQNGVGGSGAATGKGTRLNKYSTATTVSSRKSKKSGVGGPWSATDVDDTDADVDGFSDADMSGMSLGGLGVGASTLFLPPNTVFWLPYALTLVSRHPIYDLMRDYLTLSWARFSKDVQSHTLQINKILEFPAPRAGEMIKLDAGVSGESMEVVCRFPGGMDFGRGLVDVNFTMWPLFQCLNIDNILTICELALAPTGRILFLSRHPVMLGIAVSTIKYLVELRGWNGISLPIVHARDAKIYLEDPGPWIMGLPTECRYITRIQPEICVCDLDINFVNCSAPPANVVSLRGQRDKFRKVLMSAFDQYYHPDHSIPSEFKEAFPAGRFRPLCKIVTKKGNTSTPVAEIIRAPDWWHQTKVVQAFDVVLRDKYKKPPLIKRLAMLRGFKQPARLTPAEMLIQSSIRKRASAFVDARDDLETKIGRLSRRLNFLLTEAELWRQKFVSFEEYAETLSAEAAELRAKIGKEQRESKRLSGLVQMSTHEKDELKNKLYSTESAHREAIVELERMKEEMDEMERERSQMIAEVEAQIERALVSMAFSDNMSDTGTNHGMTRAMSESGTMNEREFPNGGVPGSRPGSAMSSRASSRAGQPLSEKALRRFSAQRRDSNAGALHEVDYGISERTDAVAQKMLAIQQKVRRLTACHCLFRDRELTNCLCSLRLLVWRRGSAERIPS